MKKINKKDLSLNKETVSGLTNSDKSMPETLDVTNCLACKTIYTCESLCQQATYPGYCEECESNGGCLAPTVENCNLEPLTDENVEFSKCVCGIISEDNAELTKCGGIIGTNNCGG